MNGKLPADSRKVRKVVVKAVRYQLIGNDLYIRTYMWTLLICVAEKQVKLIMGDIYSTEIMQRKYP